MQTQPNFPQITKRRAFLKQAGLASFSIIAAGLGANPAVADPDPASDASTPAAASSSPEPDIYSFSIGGMEAFIIHDGSLVLPTIQPAFVPEAKPAEIEELQSRNFLSSTHLAMSLNVLVLKTKSGVALFDSGAGRAFGPVGGRLVRGLARLGIGLGDVKTVFVTHAHSDHIAGLVAGENQPLFRAAKIVAARKEIEFWNSDTADLSGMRTPAEDTAKMHAAIKDYLGAVKPSLELREPGKVSAEVELIDTKGHTPGHAAFLVRVGEERLLVIGDTVHVYSLQFPHPEWTMAYDVNPTQAIATRRELFKKAADERTLLLGYHLPFPGLGHVRAAGSGYEWVARPWVG